MADINRIGPVGGGWKAAMTTLGAERHALSGVAKSARRVTRSSVGSHLAEVLAMARDRGRTDDSVVRDLLAQAYTADRLLTWTSQRSRDRSRSGQPAGPEGSITKIAKALTNQRLQEVAMELLGRRRHGMVDRRRRSAGVDHPVPAHQGQFD